MPHRNRDQQFYNAERDNRYLRENINRETNDPGDYHDVDDVLYHDGKPSRLSQGRDRYIRRDASPNYGASGSPRDWSDRDSYSARRADYDYDASNFGRGYRDDGRGFAQNYGRYTAEPGPGHRPSTRPRGALSDNPLMNYGNLNESDSPYFTGAHGGQVHQEMTPNHPTQEEGFDSDYWHWRSNELRRHDTAYNDWRRAQAQNYDTAYSEWRKSRQDQFAKDFTDWRSSRATMEQQAGVSKDVTSGGATKTDLKPSK